MVLQKDAEGFLASIELEFAPAADLESVGRSDVLTCYVATADKPQFAVTPLPADLPTGMYRFDIATPNAADILDQSVILAEIDGEETPVPIRVTFDRFADRLEAFFVLPSNVGALRFAPHFYADDLRIGAVRLSRVSTTRRRLRRAGQTARRYVRSPVDLGRDVTFLGRTLWAEGVPGLQREGIEAISPTRILPIDVDMYVGWFARTIGTRNREALATLAAATPRADAALSIVVPIYKTPEAWLAQLLASIERQTDRDFELVLVFDGPQPALQAFAEGRLGQVRRWKSVTVPQNGGAAAASNHGIHAASGDYVVVVDHDDMLEKHFVEAFRLAATAKPADIYFADEAITDGKMHLVRAVATRGLFDIRYYLSHPYIVHPIFIRRDLVVRAGLFDETLRVSHDVDLFLRCLALADNVVQIPLLLYFWRTHERSLGHVAAGEVGAHTKAAIRRYLSQRLGWTSFEVRDGFNFNEYDVRPPLPSGARAAIVIPTKNRMSILSTCLASLYAAKRCNRIDADIYVVDHDSDDPQTLAFLAREKAEGRIDVIAHSGPWNFAAINNAAVRVALSRGEYSHLVFMNNDIEIVTDDWLDRLIGQFSYPDVGTVGCCLRYPDGRVQHAGVVIGMFGAAEHAHKFEPLTNATTGRRLPSHLCSLVSTRDYNAVTAALMIVPTRLFEAVGGFDEKLAVGFNDTDLCLRIGALGFHSTYVGGVVATHYESISRGAAPHEADTRLFRSRYADLIEGRDDYWGAMLDRTTAAAKISMEPQKDFRLVETRL